MVQAAAEHDAQALPTDAPLVDEATWQQVFASLATLQAGLDKVKNELGRMRCDIEAFRKAVE